MTCRSGHRGNQGHGRGATADDDDPLTGVVQILGPVLRVDHLSGEILDALELGREALVVAVVTRAAQQELSGEFDRLTRMLDLQRPQPTLGGPLGADDLVAESDLFRHTELTRSLGHVLPDGGAVGDALGARPGPEVVAEREHVRIRAHTRVAEQIPGAADALARLQHHELLARQLTGDTARHADTRDPGAHDDNVDMFGHDS
ncbi:Uncharacterised protein [Mycobacteroides abscessus subsp. abscessus]|nr:Uncharacterised protein [Mycobacteroides abscessus subsp. abscessus]